MLYHKMEASTSLTDLEFTVSEIGIFVLEMGYNLIDCFGYSSRIKTTTKL